MGGLGFGAPPLFIYFHIFGHLSGLELPLTPVAMVGSHLFRNFANPASTGSH